MNYEEIINKQREFFKSGQTYSYAFRKAMLEKLYAALDSFDSRILQALKEDLNKPEFEGYMTELGIVKSEISHTLKHLKKWLKPIPVKSELIHFPAKSYRVSEPLGVALIMSPWNYPVQLTLAPVVAAIAAGNCVVIKPSRFSAATSKVLKEMIEQAFSPEYITLFEGGSEVNTALLDIRFDHIMFTGSVNVGKIVMEKAAKFLCPVTLELGGKSPCIVDRDANIPLAAKRIMWGKSINSGQTCVAPDYLFVHADVKEQLISCMQSALKEMYGESTIMPQFCKIINERHFLRLKALQGEGKILFGGDSNADTQQIELTAIEDFSLDSDLFKEEIFGPILPVITFTDMGEVVKTIQSKPKPLAFYLFAKSKKMQEFLIREIPFGGGTINDVVMHLTNLNMPFGGVGESGMGGYHGYDGFVTFSHIKSIMKRGKLDIKMRYAPYKSDKLLRVLMK